MDLRTRLNDAVAWRIPFTGVCSHLDRAMLEHALAAVRSSGIEILTMRRAFERVVPS